MSNSTAFTSLPDPLQTMAGLGFAAAAAVGGGGHDAAAPGGLYRHWCLDTVDGPVPGLHLHVECILAGLAANDGNSGVAPARCRSSDHAMRTPTTHYVSPCYALAIARWVHVRASTTRRRPGAFAFMTETCCEKVHAAGLSSCLDHACDAFERTCTAYSIRCDTDYCTPLPLLARVLPCAAVLSAVKR